MSMSDITTYASFNSFTVQGRIFAAELIPYNGSEFVAITVITNCVNDDEGMTVKFTNSNGLVSLFKKGGLPIGRMVTVTGHIKHVSETYTKDGEVRLLKRPNIDLIDASIPTGGLGAMPKSVVVHTRPQGVVVRPSDAKPSVDKAPVLEEKPF